MKNVQKNLENQISKRKNKKQINPGAQRKKKKINKYCPDAKKKKVLNKYFCPSSKKKTFVEKGKTFASKTRVKRFPIPSWY